MNRECEKEDRLKDLSRKQKQSDNLGCDNSRSRRPDFQTYDYERLKELPDNFGEGEV